MKYLMIAIVMFALGGCTAKTIQMFESNTDEVAHKKALEILGSDTSDKGLVYSASLKAKECLHVKLTQRGYWLLQDEIDCFDNSIVTHSNIDK